MDVTLLYINGCPSWQEADAHLRTLAEEIPDLTIHRQLVETAEAAAQYRFRGSPSIHVNGLDLFARTEDPVGMCCRVYETANGLAGSPTLEQMRSAVTSAKRN